MAPAEYWTLHAKAALGSLCVVVRVARSSRSLLPRIKAKRLGISLQRCARACTMASIDIDCYDQNKARSPQSVWGLWVCPQKGRGALRMHRDTGTYILTIASDQHVSTIGHFPTTRPVCAETALCGCHRTFSGLFVPLLLAQPQH